jgi:hypothetical protein
MADTQARWLDEAPAAIASGNFKKAVREVEDVLYKSGREPELLREAAVVARTIADSADGRIAKRGLELADALEKVALRKEEGALSESERAQAAYEARALEEKMTRFKVLTQKDRFFAGKFDPEKLEAAINAYAAQGWEPIAMATASIPGGIGGTRDEMVVLMRREAQGER